MERRLVHSESEQWVVTADAPRLLQAALSSLLSFGFIVHSHDVVFFVCVDGLIRQGDRSFRGTAGVYAGPDRSAGDHVNGTARGKLASRDRISTRRMIVASARVASSMAK